MLNFFKVVRRAFCNLSVRILINYLMVRLYGHLKLKLFIQLCKITKRIDDTLIFYWRFIIVNNITRYGNINIELLFIEFNVYLPLIR